MLNKFCISLGKSQEFSSTISEKFMIFLILLMEDKENKDFREVQVVDTNLLMSKQRMQSVKSGPSQISKNTCRYFFFFLSKVSGECHVYRPRSTYEQECNNVLFKLQKLGEINNASYARKLRLRTLEIIPMRMASESFQKRESRVLDRWGKVTGVVPMGGVLLSPVCFHEVRKI